MGAVISGTRNRHEIEERMKGMLDEAVRSEGRIILFVPEFFLIVGKIPAEWSYEVASLFKSALQRDGFRCIGIATQKEYNNFVDVDPVLRRHFEPIYVAEPSVEDTIAILRGIKERYKIHHKVRSRLGPVAAAKLAHADPMEKPLPARRSTWLTRRLAGSPWSSAVPTEIDLVQRRCSSSSSPSGCERNESHARAPPRSRGEDRRDEKKLQDLSHQWKMEKSGLGDVQQMRERLAAVHEASSSSTTSSTSG